MISFVFTIIIPRSIPVRMPSSQPRLFGVQGISRRLFSVSVNGTVPMHSTLIIKDLHDKSTASICAVNQNAVFDTIECVVNFSKAA